MEIDTDHIGKLCVQMNGERSVPVFLVYILLLAEIKGLFTERNGVVVGRRALKPTDKHRPGIGRMSRIVRRKQFFTVFDGQVIRHGVLIGIEEERCVIAVFIVRVKVVCAERILDARQNVNRESIRLKLNGISVYARIQDFALPIGFSGEMDDVYICIFIQFFVQQSDADLNVLRRLIRLIRLRTLQCNVERSRKRKIIEGFTELFGSRRNVFVVTRVPFLQFSDH